MKDKKAARRAAPNQSPAKRVWFGEEKGTQRVELSPQGEAEHSGVSFDEGRFG